MLVDAIILTGGRSSRLDSVPKSEFVVEDDTLLGRTLTAASVARRVVVVGHEPSAALPVGVMLVREEPPFSGPVAAVAAGVAALRSMQDAQNVTDESDAPDAPPSESGTLASDALLVFACDMPHIARAVASLTQALEESPEADGSIAVDAENRRQPLAALYRTNALVAALESAAGTAPTAVQGDPLAGLPMFRLLDQLSLVDVEVPHDATADVDTWDDAVRLGARPPASSTAQPSPN